MSKVFNSSLNYSKTSVFWVLLLIVGANPTSFLLASSAQQKKSGIEERELANLKKELPKIVSSFIKSMKSLNKVIFDCSPDDVKVRMARQISSSKSKIVIEVNQDGRKSVLIMFLKYYDGMWTTIRYETSFIGAMVGFRDQIPFLLLEIDEFGEKNRK